MKEERKIADVTFTSSRKRATVVVRKPNKEGAADEVRVYTKGAPDVLFPICSHMINETGEMVSIDSVTKADPALWNLGEGSGKDDITADGGNCSHLDALERTVKLFASKAYRTILVTYKDMSMARFDQLKAEFNNFEKDINREEAFENGLCAYGLFGLQDPLRETIVASIEQCHSSKIRVIMCTGDNIDTAAAISK